MQSAKTIFGTSIIILILFSFPRSYGFRNNICSRDSQLNSNCQEQRVNIYHQFEKHLNNNAVRNNVDVRRERLLQIRAVGNDRERDLSVRSVTRERSYSRISPESIIVRQNRERNLLVRNLRVFEQSDRFRDSRNRVQLRERSTPERESRITGRNRETNIRNSDRVQIRERSSLNGESRFSDRRTLHLPEHTQKSERLQTQEMLSPEKKARSTEIRISERDVRNSRTSERVQEKIDRVREINRLQVRERLSPERESRSVERKISERDSRDSRTSERVIKNTGRIRESRDQLQVRGIESRFVERRMSERDNRDSRKSERVRDNNDRVRESRERLQNRDRLSLERESRTIERKISERVSRDSRTSERVREHTDRIRESRNLLQVRGIGSRFVEQRISERDNRDSSKSERVHNNDRGRESRERFQVRERLFPERESRSVERRISERDVQNSRTSEQIRENTDRVAESRNRLQVQERLTPERESRFIERRMSERNDRDSRKPDRVRDNNIDRVREFREHPQVREKLFPERESRSVERRISERNVRDRENTDRIRKSNNRLQVQEKDSRSVERRISERDVRDSRSSERVRVNTDRIRESRNRLQVRERLYPETESRRRTSERDARDLETNARVGNTDRVRISRKRETSIKRKTEIKFSDRRISKRDTRLSENNGNTNNVRERRDDFRERKARVTGRQTLDHIRAIETREQQSLERSARLSERRNNCEIRSQSLDNVRIPERHNNERDTRLTNQVNIREPRISGHIREARRLSPKIDSRISDQRADGSNFIRREISSRFTANNIRLNDRNTESKEREIYNSAWQNRRNSIQHESRSVHQSPEFSEQISKSRKFLQENERISELRNYYRNTNNRESRVRSFDYIRSAGHREQPQEVRLSERESTERISNTREIRTVSRKLQQIREQISSDRNSRLSRSNDRQLNTRDSTDSEKAYRDQTTSTRKTEGRKQIRNVRISEKPIQKARLQELLTERQVSNERRDIRYSHTQFPSQDRRITERRTITRGTEQGNNNRRVSGEQRDITSSRNIRENGIRETRDSRYSHEQDNRIADRRNKIRDSKMSLRSVTVPEESKRISIRSEINRNSRTVLRSSSRERLINPTEDHRINNEESNIRKKKILERQEIRSLNNRYNRENVISNLKQHLKNIDTRRLFSKDAKYVQILYRSTNKRQNERLSRLSKNSERLIDNKGRINIQRDRVLDQERLGYIQKISDRRLNERQMNILSRERKDGFHFALDQRDMSVFRIAYPTNKVQDFSVEFVENIWINVVKILLASLLFLQISRSKTADLKIFKCARVPVFSQLFKEKVQ